MGVSQSHYFPYYWHAHRASKHGSHRDSSQVAGQPAGTGLLKSFAEELGPASLVAVGDVPAGWLLAAWMPAGWLAAVCQRALLARRTSDASCWRAPNIDYVETLSSSDESDSGHHSIVEDTSTCMMTISFRYGGRAGVDEHVVCQAVDC